MKILALVLIIGAFLAGAFLSVLDPTSVNWSLMVPVLVVGTVGLWLHHRLHHGASRDEHLLTGNIQILSTSLDNIVLHLEALHSRKADLPTHEARFEIDRLFREDLNNFADARESMQHVFGMQNYADVMSNFAAGERYINRVWSASTDGYVDEVNSYIDRALDQFRLAQEHYHQLRIEHSGESAGN